MAEISIDWRTLQTFVQALFEKMGLPPDDAATEAQVLVWANRRGVDSHGVLRVPQYLRSVRAGGMNPRPAIRIEKELPAALIIEADHAFGPVVTCFAMERVIDKARAAGVAWGLIRNTTHQGAMGYYALMAAQQGLAGIAGVCNPPNMAPTGARAAGVHNSPLAIAVPGGDHRPICLDMATSVVAFGKVDLARDKGVSLPEGWALDADGQPTTDPNRARIMVPVGGYKGYGLALMFECLSSLLAGNALLAPVLNGDEPPRAGTQNSVVMAVDIGLFTDLHAYREAVDATVDGLKALPRREGVDEIFVPGELEDREAERRERAGIPLPEGTVRNLRKAAQDLGVALPAALA